VVQGDREFLIGLYGSVREPELAHVRWDDTMRRAFVEHQFAAQDAHYREHYPGATLDVIEIDGSPAGRLYVHRGAREIRKETVQMPTGDPVLGCGLGCRQLLGNDLENGDAGSGHARDGSPTPGQAAPGDRRCGTRSARASATTAGTLPSAQTRCDLCPET
jgi:hypothetical protein